MKTSSFCRCGLIAMAFLVAIPGSAQSSQYTMTTDIPPGIAMPDSVETRLGTLKFFDGFPDDASVEKIYDNLDFQRAVQVYSSGVAGREHGRPARGFTAARAAQHHDSDI